MNNHSFVIVSTEPGSVSGGPRIHVACECGGWQGTVSIAPGLVRKRDLEWMKGRHDAHKREVRGIIEPKRKYDY